MGLVAHPLLEISGTAQVDSEATQLKKASFGPLRVLRTRRFSLHSVATAT